VLRLLASLRKNRRLLVDLVRRDLSSRYVGSTMGLFWSVIFPIINLVVYMFVFRIIMKSRWSDKQGPAEVALLMLTGIMAWHALSESLIRMTGSLVDNANLIQKVVFPSEVLPVSLTISALVNMLIGTVIALGAVVYFAYVKPLPPEPPARPIAFGAHVPGGRSVAPPLTSGVPFHCASHPESTKFTATSVRDDSVEPWTAEFDDRGGGHLLQAGWADRVYAATGEWSVVASKKGVSLEVEGWHDRDGKEVAPPRDGTGVIVVGPPDRPIGISISLLSIPLLIAVQGIFMLGLGSLLAALNLYVRDTTHLIGVALTVWMFATPIFYPERMVRDAGYGWLAAWNPMNWLISCYRDVLVYGDWPDPLRLARFAVVGIAALILGSSFFLAQKPRFPDLL
jgi:ABC-type polysaccharide/polyol phosphate export permease